jgi:SNF2 family DNA or RNA helicase
MSENIDVAGLFGTGDSTPDAIAKELAELRELLTPLAATIAEAEETKKELKREEIALNEQIREIRNKAYDIDNSVRDARRKMQDAERKMASAERRYQESLVAARQREELRALSDELDKLTAGAPWREFAFDHQISGAKKLAVARRAILADKPGLGKTLTATIYLDMVKSKKAICVVPNDTQDNFIQEISHWAPHRAPHVIRLGNLSKGERSILLNMVLPTLDEFIIVINFEGWRRDQEVLMGLINLQADTLIIDESHNAKNRQTKAWKGLRSMVTSSNQCPSCRGSNIRRHESAIGVSSEVCGDCGYAPKHGDFFTFNSVQNVLPMTGTPILNRPQDLSAQLALIDPVAFGSERDFLRDYCYEGFDGKWRFRKGGLESLSKKLAARFVMRDRKSAGIVIPPQGIQYHNVNLDAQDYPKQYEMLRALNERALILLEQEGQAMPVSHVIALITRKRQAVTWGQGIEFKDPKTGVVLFRADCDESIKIDKVINVDPERTGNGPTGLIPDLIGDYDSDTHRWIGGERVVLFSQFKQPLHEIKRRLDVAGISSVIFDGDTPQDIRNEIRLDMDARTADPENYKYQVILANYRVGGVGLNFTAASQMIILDEEWNPGKVEQAYGRIDRMGQTKETTVHVIRLNNSIDTWMAALIEEKQDIVDGLESSIDMQQRLIDGIEGGML